MYNKIWQKYHVFITVLKKDLQFLGQSLYPGRSFAASTVLDPVVPPVPRALRRPPSVAPRRPWKSRIGSSAAKDRESSSTRASNDRKMDKMWETWNMWVLWGLKLSYIIFMHGKFIKHWDHRMKFGSFCWRFEQWITGCIVGAIAGVQNT